MSTPDLLAHEFPTPPFLIEPMIPLGGAAILHGKPNVGKTQFVLTMAHAINTGVPLFGRWPVEQGAVVVLQADMTGHIQKARVARATRQVRLDSTYWAVEADGAVPTINIQSLPVTKRDLVTAIREIEPVLIVYDTLRKVHRLDENSSATVIAVLEAARKICPLATHLFLHHDRKESRDPDASAPADEAFMGSQQWLGAVDTTFSLKEIGSGHRSPKRIICEFHKARTAPDFMKRPFTLELDLDTMLLLPLGARDPDHPLNNLARCEARRLS